MLERLRNWLRPKPTTLEELQARAEGHHIREGVETLRTGSLASPPMNTHGGFESRGRETPD